MQAGQTKSGGFVHFMAAISDDRGIYPGLGAGNDAVTPCV